MTTTKPILLPQRLMRDATSFVEVLSTRREDTIAECQGCGIFLLDDEVQACGDCARGDTVAIRRFLDVKRRAVSS
jgi:hypothetical protein